jgi:fatty acid desaturase
VTLIVLMVLAGVAFFVLHNVAHGRKPWVA